MNLTAYKAKHLAASKGFDLLKRKSDALKVLQMLHICLVLLTYTVWIWLTCTSYVFILAGAFS